MAPKWISPIVATMTVSTALAQTPSPGGIEGWSGGLLSNITLQTSAQDALRSRPTPFRQDLVTDHSGRLLNLVNLRYVQGVWALTGTYSDSRTVGGGSAYSLSSPTTYGVNTVETYGGNRRAVDAKSGLQELAVKYENSGTTVVLGKVDTGNWYLAAPLFSGDLSTSNDFAHAATRVVAPPFPSVALVVRQDLGQGYDLTAIAGDAFGDRETLHAARNLRRGDLAYVLELNHRDRQRHHQLTLIHTDSFRFYDKDAVWPGPGEKAPKVDALIATFSHRFNPSWAAFTRVGHAWGKAQLEDANYLIGVRYDQGKFYALASQSASRVAIENTPYQRGKKGDITLVSEITLNYKIHPSLTVGLTYDAYASRGASLLAKDGGVHGARRNQIIGLRMTSWLPF